MCKQAIIGAFFSQVSPDAWVQSVGSLIGTFLGALIAGMISLLLLRKQRKDENLAKLKEEYEEFMKFMVHYRRPLDTLMENLRLIEMDIRESQFERRTELVEVCRQAVEKMVGIPTDRLSYTAEERVNSLHQHVRMLLLVISMYASFKGDIYEKSFFELLKDSRDRAASLKRYVDSLERKLDMR